MSHILWSTPSTLADNFLTCNNCSAIGNCLICCILLERTFYDFKQYLFKLSNSSEKYLLVKRTFLDFKQYLFEPSSHLREDLLLKGTFYDIKQYLFMLSVHFKVYILFRSTK